jgi:DNA-binding CsgD family transcriptional regulator
VTALTGAGLEVIGVGQVAELSGRSVEVLVLNSAHDAAAGEGAAACRLAVATTARLVMVHDGEDGHAVRDGVAIRLTSVDGGVAGLIAAIHAHDRTGRRRWQSPSIGPVPLSARETGILRSVASGATCREIGEEFGISTRTVENHKRRIFLKLGVHNQAQAVAVAARTGLLPAAGALA